MARQETLALYGKGIVKTRRGHLRYTSPKELRGKYVHRVIVDKLLEETPYSIKLLLPWPYEVHHADWNKENNSPENFILVSESLHSVMTADRGRQDNGRFGRQYIPKTKDVSEWLLGMEDATPF